MADNEQFFVHPRPDGRVSVMIQNWNNDFSEGGVQNASFTTTPREARVHAIRLLEAAQKAEDLAINRKIEQEMGITS